VGDLCRGGVGDVCNSSVGLKEPWFLEADQPAGRGSKRRNLVSARIQSCEERPL